MKTYEERAKMFIKELLKYREGNTFKKTYGIQRTVREFLDAHPYRKVSVSAGSARTAIITSDYVIKIDTGDVIHFGGCEDEVDFYNYASEWKMEHLLAKPTPFWYDGIYFYIYPRATVYENTNQRRDWYHELTRDEREFIDLIDDLHEGNIGFLHGKFCIIDYAMNNY